MRSAESSLPKLNLVSRQIAMEIPPTPNCTATQVPFPKLGRRAIDVRFDGGDVSSDGGLLLLRQVERRLGLLKAVAKVLPDPRNPWLVQHTTEQLLRQRVFGLCQGYEDLNDHDRLRDEPTFLKFRWIWSPTTNSPACTVKRGRIRVL